MIEAAEYDRAVEALAEHSRDGVKDEELIAGASAIIGVLAFRFGRDGEYRGGSDAADAVERLESELAGFRESVTA